METDYRKVLDHKDIDVVVGIPNDLHQQVVVTAGEVGETKAWTFTVIEEVFLYGFPHKMRHFTHAMPGEEELMETGDDRRSTLEIIYAAHESAAG